MNPIDVLVVSAHPDDAEFAMGGTMIKLARAGKTMLHLCLTRGEMGSHGSVEIRKQEFESACKFLGCEGIQLDFGDTKIENTHENRLALCKIIRERKPKIVFSPYHTNPVADFGGISNRDHSMAGAIVRDAVKFARLETVLPGVPKHTIQKLYFYFLPRDMWPFLGIEIVDVMDEFRQLIACYKSQLKVQFHNRPIEDLIYAKRTSLGLDVGAQCAEAFVTEMALRMKPDTFFEV